MLPTPVRELELELDAFEGPLDLLLHLVKKHELDIFDIPISFITEKYIAYIDLMTSLNLDVAGEYLLMAATLAHIKSRELLPAAPPGTEEGEEGELDELDPREELRVAARGRDDLADRGRGGIDRTDQQAGDVAAHAIVVERLRMSPAQR